MELQILMLDEVSAGGRQARVHHGMFQNSTYMCMRTPRSMIDTDIWNAIAGVLRVAQQTRRRAGAPDDLGALHMILFGDFKRLD